jgi:hypothetical protein
VNRMCGQRRNRRHSSYRTRRRSSEALGGAVRDVTCQERPIAETQAARLTLQSAGATVPDCSGTVAPVAKDDKGAEARLTCFEPSRLISLRAQSGNTGSTCEAPPASFCACGPACSPLPPESACFSDPNGFELGTNLVFRALWQARVALDSVKVESLPQDSQSVVDRKPVYTRVR